MEKPRTYETLPQGHTAHSYGHEGMVTNTVMFNSSSNQETLALFPLHPTGILQGKEGQNPCGLFAETTSTSSTKPSYSSGVEEGPGPASDQKHFYNFFSEEQGFCDTSTTTTTATEGS